MSASPPGSAARTHLARAQQRDAAGQHGEAVEELALGMDAGDAECRRMLGLRLLLGDRAPLNPGAAFDILGVACDRDGGEAGARVAGIVALGVRARPDLPHALAWLARSAAAGWNPSQRQLLALCDDRELAARAATQSRVDWQGVAAAVRLGDWQRAPAAHVLHDDPRVATFVSLLRAEVCAFLISLAQGRLEPARVYHAASGQEKVDAHRTNTLATFHVDTIELVQVLLQLRMAAACGFGGPFMEPPSVLHYSPGQQIRDHYDFVDPASTPDYAGEIARHGQRIITFIVYLNDEYEGGETDFPRLGVRNRGGCGDGIYFVNAKPDLSPDTRMLHAGRPPTHGEKWIVTQFVRSKAMR